MSWRARDSRASRCPSFVEKDGSIGTRRHQAPALQPLQGLSGGHVRHAEAPREIDQPRLAGARYQLGDHLDIVLRQLLRVILAPAGWSGLCGMRFIIEIAETNETTGTEPAEEADSHGGTEQRRRTNGKDSACDRRPATPAARDRHGSIGNTNLRTLWVCVSDRSVTITARKAGRSHATSR